MYANCHDTLLAHHAFASHLPQRLDQVVSEYCDSAPWKVQHGMRDVGEKGAVIEGMNGEELCLYNGQDARLTALSWKRMQADLDTERGVYEHDIGLARVCHEMQWAGVGIDTVRRDELMGALRGREADLRASLRSLSSHPEFNPGKLGEVRAILFDHFGAVGGKRTPGGQLSTNDETLEGLAGETPLGRFAECLLQWRLVGKIQSTYLASVNVRDGRCHYNWKPFGTVSGRLSSRAQSVPRWSPTDPDDGHDTPEGRAREIYVPAPGNVFVYFDVSQAEMRLAAYLANDPAFMKVANGSDVHAGNAKQVFPEIAAKGWLDGDAKKDPMRGKPYRDIAKNLGFAISYGAEDETVFVTLRRKGFNVSMRSVALILGRLKSAYKVYYHWGNANLERVRVDGYMRSPVMGRIRRFGRFPKPTDIMNYPVQSALADIVNMRMISLSKRVPGVAPLVFQVHDSCIYDTPRGMATEVEGFIKEAWGEAVALAGGDLVLPIDLKRGERLSDL